MTRLLTAIQFLTILRLTRRSNSHDLEGSVSYFPVVGLALGLLLAGLNACMSYFGFNQVVMNILLISTLIMLTGALHLDGLCDTADALFSGKDRHEMLRIMKDPHIGAMGAISLIVVIIIKIALLSSIAIEYKSIALILMCLLGRWVCVLAIFGFQYARDNGKASVFMVNRVATNFFTALLLTAAISLIVYGIKGLLISIFVTLIAYLITSYISNRLRGITGDSIGAAVELTEIACLATLLIWPYMEI